MTVPKLRFKEFINDWKITSLGSEIGISSASRVLKEQWRASGVPFFRTSDVISIFKSEENQKVFISYDLFEKLSNKSGRIKKGDLLITGGGSIGIPYLKKDNSPLYFKDADLLWLKSSEKINGEFLYNFFQSQSFKVYLKSISHTGTISHFTIEQAKTTPINLPSKEEQTKIANFLTTVDKKISQLNEQHQLMIQYKKGVMQKIFSQEIRFKDDNGEEFGEWQNIQIKDIFSVTRGQVLSVSQTLEYKDDIYQYPVYSSQTKNKGLLGYYSDYLYQDAITWTTDGANAGEVNFRKGKFYCTNVCGVLLSNKGYANSCVSEILNSIAKRYVSYVGNPKLMNNVMSEILINIPSDLREQTKISDFLTELDSKIENLASQLDLVKKWKKGLLQQMFV
jgi:hypothetical protein